MIKKFKRYRLCPVLSDDYSDWQCLKRECHFYFCNGCYLSIGKELIKKLIMDKLKKGSK